MNDGDKGEQSLRLDVDVIAELSRYKAPCEPDLNAVLRRLFELDYPKSQRNLIERAATSPSEYRKAILKALVAEGGEARMVDIYDHVASTLSDVLKPVDREDYDTGVRWQTAIRTVTNSSSKNSMRKQGVIEYDKYDKVFRITEKGRKELSDKTE